MSVRTVDVAYDILKQSNASLPFKDLWAGVAKNLNYSDQQTKSKISQFYTDLSLDGRFISSPGNIWNLKTRVKYEEIDLSEDEDDAEDDEDGDEEDEGYIEEDEY